jgi:hypothetical protein
MLRNVEKSMERANQRHLRSWVSRTYAAKPGMESLRLWLPVLRNTFNNNLWRLLNNRKHKANRLEVAQEQKRLIYRISKYGRSANHNGQIGAHTD